MSMVYKWKLGIKKKQTYDNVCLGMAVAAV